MHTGMNADPTSRSERARAALRQVAPFATAAWLAPTLVLLATAVAHPMALLAATLLMLPTAGTVLAVIAGWAPARWHNPAVLSTYVALALIIHAAGGLASGVNVVLLAPVVWMSLYGRGRSVVAALITEIATVGVLALLDGPHVADQDVRRIVLFLTVSVLIAGTVARLVSSLSVSKTQEQAGRRVLAEVASVTRALREGPDVRNRVCEAVRTVADASVTLLFEPDGEDLVVTASAGIGLPELRMPKASRSATALSFRSNQPFFIAETVGDPQVDTELVTTIGGRSLLAQPFGHGGVVRGVVLAVWSVPQRHAEPTTTYAVRLLADDIAVALERADLLASLQALATTDPLTGLANRRVWRARLPNLLSSSSSTCVALLDLDHFKALNDSRGHLAGDKLLRELATAWRPLLRPTDLLVRWGGEEFALAMGECPPQQAMAIVKRLCAAVPQGQTVSAGIAQWDGSESIESLMSRADAALYRSKEGGRNRVVSAESLDEPLDASDDVPLDASDDASVRAGTA